MVFSRTAGGVSGGGRARGHRREVQSQDSSIKHNPLQLRWTQLLIAVRRYHKLHARWCFYEVRLRLATRQFGP